MVDQPVGQGHRPEFQAAIEGAGPGEAMRHGGAKAANRALLDREQHLVLTRQTG